ncbi:hypothetical protein [Stakelama pacifica]|uniref:DUF2188 domain-containing protein n=1 Tax=Stakelama pacifica TaxID=517720 RepID=A0A4R6FL22_9SPHN|nr:hypothetical protein [Stakelama pacifica]MAW98580.1 hypothetical protein [Sphingomonas sp.]TDN82206.1 hypothetical protein EV664_10612 [Stakelama pacifica]GGO95974.1 hypothetical protein GCM10011329_21430 [Stakelama pacifica]
MSRDNLYVEPRQDQWQVRSDNQQGDADLEIFDSKEAAVDAAILSAQNSAKRGRRGHVYVEESNGAFHLEREFEPGRI